MQLFLGCMNISMRCDSPQSRLVRFLSSCACLDQLKRKWGYTTQDTRRGHFSSGGIGRAAPNLIELHDLACMIQRLDNLLMQVESGQEGVDNLLRQVNSGEEGGATTASSVVSVTRDTRGHALSVVSVSKHCRSAANLHGIARLWVIHNAIGLSLVLVFRRLDTCALVALRVVMY